jgi:acetyl esterase/lipase
VAVVDGILTLVAAVAAVGTGAVAYYMVRPVGWGGRGMLGVFALLFPLHLLAVVPAAAVLAALAAWADAAVALGLAAVTAAALVVMALWPAAAAWRRARRLGVRLSLRRYAAESRRPNFGGADPQRTVVYGTAGGTKLELDAWPAAPAAAARPAVVRVHGGGWTGGGRGDQGAWNRWLNERGYHVFDVDYRLPPPERWQDEVADVKAALRWVAASAPELGVDATRIAVMGNSAGGNLAMLAAYSADPGAGDVVPVCVVNVYGPGDLTLFYRSTGSPDYVQDALRRYIGGPPDAHPDRYRAVSPVVHVAPTSPPTLTTLGERDRIVPLDQARALDTALTAAGIAHETVLLPAADHGFDTNWGGFGTQIAQARIERFLAGHLGPA